MLKLQFAQSYLFGLVKIRTYTEELIVIPQNKDERGRKSFKHTIIVKVIWDVLYWQFYTGYEIGVTPSNGGSWLLY